MIRTAILAATITTLLAMPANAATITLTFTATGLSVPLTKTLTDADMLRIVNALKSYYPPNTDAQGNPIAWTNASVLAKYGAGLMSGLQGLVLQVEQQAAQSTAAAGVAPVGLN